MSQNSKPTLALLLIFTFALALSNHALAGREIPENPNTNDEKQPQFFIDHDGSYLVPGIGRFMFPKKGQGYNPFTYDPVTGTNTGIHTGIGGDSSGWPSHSQIPGGDDTFLPSPVVGIPIPGISGSPTSRHSHIPGGDDTFLPSPGTGFPIPGIGGYHPSPASP